MATYARKKQERGLLFSCPEWSSLFFLFYSFSCFLLSPITLALPCSVSRLSYFSLIHRARWVIRGRREMVDLAANLNKYGHARPKERWTKGRELGSASETSLRNAWVRTSRCGKFISFSHFVTPWFSFLQSNFTERKLDRSITSRDIFFLASWEIYFWNFTFSFFKYAVL